MVGEQGPEPFFPGVSGTIMSNHNMREALSGANSGAGAVRLVVDARTDGSVDLKIRAAEHRATVSGGALGAQMVSKMFKSQRST